MSTTTTILLVLLLLVAASLAFKIVKVVARLVIIGGIAGLLYFLLLPWMERFLP